MTRYLFAMAAALCSLAPLSAQEGGFATEREGTLAPTVPVVPAPVLQNGNLLTPAGGSGSWGASGPRFFSFSKLMPARSPVAMASDPSLPPPGYNYAPPAPPLPTGVLNPDSCGPAGCGSCGYGHGHERGRSCWEHIKAWWCFAPSKTELPMCRPSAYTPPLLGMFPCTGKGYNCASCGTGCANGCGTVPYPVQPPVTLPPAPKPMTPPMPPSGAGPVMMPPRGTQGIALPPTIVTTSARMIQR